MRSHNDRSNTMRAKARMRAVFITKLTVSTAAALVLSLPQAALRPAAAQEQERTARVGTMPFDIPAQSLASALNAFGRQSGLQVSLAAATSRGVTSTAVKGDFTPQEALARLLEGTGTRHSITADGTAIVTARHLSPLVTGSVEDGSTTLERITVDGQQAGEGDVAELNITAEDLERRNPANIQDVFREEPSVKVGSSLPMSQKVYVHGIEETNLAVSIDGSRQNNKVFHHNATTLIDPSLLKAVSVDEGVAPADAGPGALAGSIKYETKDVSDFLDGNGFGGFLNSSYNTNGGIFTNGIAGYGRQDGLEFLGYFNLGRGDNFSAGNGSEVLGTGTHFLSGIGKVSYQFESGDRVEISHEGINDDAARPFRANMIHTTGARPFEPVLRDYDLKRTNTVLTYTDETPEGWWDPKLVLAYGQTEVGTTVYLRPGLTPSSYPITGTTSTFNGKFENRFNFDIGTVTAGVDFYNDEAELGDLFEPGVEKASNVGAYVQARLQPFERARVSFGGRADRQWFTGTTEKEWDNSGLSGNISGEYDLVPEFLTAKAGYSHVWAGIPLAENFIMNPNWSYLPDPVPTTADNYVLGLAARYEGFSLEGSIFRTDIDNARAARYAVGSAYIRRHVESEGFSIGAGYDWGDGYVRVKYVDIDTQIDGRPADSDTGTYLATPVGRIFTISAAHTFTDWGLTVGGDVEIAPEYQDTFKAYEVVNTFIEYKPPSHQNLTLRAEVKNLFDETYADRATYGQEFGVVTPLYQPGRSFVLTLRATF
ncbi:TonB-dependent receptor plug domain-containing protein [Shinella sp. BYT-45]|uniref:TonB-dependent receptor n=1 Tax=Shinella sp. BYT-45 TaxID=3377377 RepID=UPI003980004D